MQLMVLYTKVGYTSIFVKLLQGMNKFCLMFINLKVFILT